MRNLRLFLSIPLVLLFLAFRSLSQEPPSLGDAARELRAAKRSGPGTTAIPAITSAGTPAKDETGEFVENARILLSHEEFDRSDRLAASVRKEKPWFVGGAWKLGRLYSAISNVPGGTNLQMLTGSPYSRSSRDGYPRSLT